MSVPVITTQRLTLRAPCLQAQAPLEAFFQTERSHWNGGPRDAVEVRQLICAHLGQWALLGHGLWFIWDQADNFVGFVGLFHPLDWPEAELGYGVVADAEGKGIAYEAVFAARQAAAGHFGLNRLPSYIDPANQRSQTLATRLGARQEGAITLRGKSCQLWRHPEVPV